MSVRGQLRQAPDTAKIAHAVIEMALAQAQAEADAEAATNRADTAGGADDQEALDAS